MFIVYRFEISEYFYIGVTSDLNTRIKNHWATRRQPNKKSIAISTLKSKIEFAKSFTVEFYGCESEALYQELYLIHKYKHLDKMLNNYPFGEMPGKEDFMEDIKSSWISKSKKTRSRNKAIKDKAFIEKWGL